MILNLLAGVVLAVNGQNFVCKPTEVLNYINITASDVTVSDCRVRDSGVGSNAISVYGNRNTLRRITVERSGATGVYFFAGTGHVLEDSVIRDPVRRVGIDSWGTYSAASGTVVIRRTTVLGSGYSMHSPQGSITLEGNRFTIPDDYRTDCNGNIQRDGPCQCGEFGIAIKAAASVVARGNTIDGYRQSDRFCGGSGTPGSGIAVTGCGPAEVGSCVVGPVTIEGNTIRNSNNGIYLAPPLTAPVRIEGNCLSGNTYAISDGFGNPSSIIDNDLAGNVNGVWLYGNRRGPVSGNRQVTACQ